MGKLKHMPKHPHMLPSDIKRKRLVKIDAVTNPHYGKPPGERTVQDLLDSSMILLDKPSGPTSHQVDAWVRDILHCTKVGHAGTLDPRVTGVLPLGIGRATRALDVLSVAGKEYVGLMRLHRSVKKDDVLRMFEKFQGDILQLPPIRSAVKRVQRTRTVYYLELLEMQERDVLFRVGCEAGTYVRTLCVDIGRQLRCGAHLSELRRTRAGGFREADTVTLHELKDAYMFWSEDDNDKEVRRVVRPFEHLFDSLPKIVIRDSSVDALCHGANLAIPGVVEVESGIKKDVLVAVFTLKGEGVAVGSSLCSSEDMIEKDSGICVNINKVLMKKGTYPSIWKKH
ncbi:MAG: RNA-guided pseudouridylation complex pseudouridine synthase subunit Cbf5 [Thermoplasmatota archaeon]